MVNMWQKLSALATLQFPNVQRHSLIVLEIVIRCVYRIFQNRYQMFHWFPKCTNNLFVRNSVVLMGIFLLGISREHDIIYSLTECWDCGLSKFSFTIIKGGIFHLCSLGSSGVGQFQLWELIVIVFTKSNNQSMFMEVESRQKGLLGTLWSFLNSHCSASDEARDQEAKRRTHSRDH